MFDKSLYKNVITLMGGTGIAQAVPIAISPILTRLYTPEEFGILAIYISIITIVGVVATGRYEMALLMPENDTDAKNLSYFSLLTVFIFTILSLLTLFFFEKDILGYLEIEKLNLLKYLIPLGIFLYATFSIYSYLLNRVRNYKAIASSKIVKSTGFSSFQLILGYLNFTTYGLILGKVFGDFISTFYSRWLVNKEESLKRIIPDWAMMKEQAMVYQEFPKVNAPHALTNTSSSNLPNLLLASFFTPAIAGFYSLSHRICFAPVQLISASVQQVYSREITDRFNGKKEIHLYTLSALKKLALLAVVPFGVLFIFAPHIFHFVFGEEWRIAGIYTQLVSPYIYLVFIVSPFTYVPLLLNKQRKAFFIDVVYLILRIGALCLGFILGSDIIAIAAFSAVGIIVQLYLLFWINSLTKIEQ